MYADEWGAGRLRYSGTSACVARIVLADRAGAARTVEPGGLAWDNAAAGLATWRQAPNFASGESRREEGDSMRAASRVKVTGALGVCLLGLPTLRLPWNRPAAVARTDCRPLSRQCRSGW